MRVLLEAETPQDPGSLFRVSVNGHQLAAGLTAVQAHVLVGDALEVFLLPSRSRTGVDRQFLPEPTAAYAQHSGIRAEYSDDGVLPATT